MSDNYPIATPDRCCKCRGEMPLHSSLEGLCPRCLLMLAFSNSLSKRRQIGDYEVIEVLGHGATGTVYKAIDPALDRFIALKVLSEILSANNQALRRFYQEATSAAQITHPNVVVIYNIGCDGDTHYISMECIEGQTLKEHITLHRRLNTTESLEIMLQVLGALDAAHSLGVVHRDIKPQNILLSSKGQIKVTDFGLAKANEEMVSLNLTLPGSLLGTPPYMSPEQCRGDSADFPSDLYSVGIVLYEMLAGTTPFRGSNAAAIIHQILTEPIPPIRSINSQIPKSVQAILKKALMKDPCKRYASASQLYAQVQNALQELKARSRRSLPHQNTHIDKLPNRKYLHVCTMLLCAKPTRIPQQSPGGNAGFEEDLGFDLQMDREHRPLSIQITGDVFPDQHLERAVRESLGYPDGCLLASNLETLTSLDASSCRIQDLHGIEHCQNLSSLILKDNAIEELSPLSPLDNIQILDLASNPISELDPIAGLISIRSLELSGKSHFSIKPLAGLANLQYLGLKSQTSSDETFDLISLSRLKQLRHLDAGNRHIQSLEPLSGLENINELCLHNTQIDNINHLGCLQRIVRLDLGNNNIRDISILDRLMRLRYLDLQSTLISSKEMACIKKLENIESLWLRNCTQVTDDTLEHLEGLPRLIRLDLGGVQCCDR